MPFIEPGDYVELVKHGTLRDNLPTVRDYYLVQATESGGPLYRLSIGLETGDWIDLKYRDRTDTYTVTRHSKQPLKERKFSTLRDEGLRGGVEKMGLERNY